MRQQVRYLDRLIHNLLAMSRDSRNGVEVLKQPVDLREIVPNVVHSTAARRNERRQKLDVWLPDKPVMIQADGFQISLVLRNLMENASKYSDDEAQISLCVEQEYRLVRIRIKDEGLGIATDEMEHLFDYLTQGKRTQARSDGGLGIGLALVRHLVELHDGSVTVRSDGVGCGSEFIVQLPTGID